jgi:ATP-binding cassette subfamily A (ABC1) protein 3
MHDATTVLIAMPLLIPFCKLIYFLLSEKELRIKQHMEIMGLTNSVYVLSWIIQYVVIFTIISFCVTIILKLSIARNSNPILIFLWHWLFSMTYLTRAFLITYIFHCTLFNISNLGLYLQIRQWEYS